jgi:hypothetical protein
MSPNQVRVFDAQRAVLPLGQAVGSGDRLAKPSRWQMRGDFAVSRPSAAVDAMVKKGSGSFTSLKVR